MLGKKIKYQRKQMNLTQMQLGMRALNLNKTHAQTRIKNIECNIGRQPDKMEIQKICKVLKISQKQLLESPDYIPPAKKQLCDGLCIPKRILNQYPNTEQYLRMLITAIDTNNNELLLYAFNGIQTQFKIESNGEKEMNEWKELYSELKSRYNELKNEIENLKANPPKRVDGHPIKII